ncbi:MAG: L,D-transpeptidase family protein [Firmicutes bacterium]|nr:L,D-transpeptidase family protein [Bacillota bacterium]
MKEQSVKVRGAALGITVMLLILGIFFACQDVHAAAKPFDETTAPTEPEKPEVKDGWQADGTYYKDGALQKGIQEIDGVLYYLDTVTGVKKTDITAEYSGKVYRFGSDGAGALYTGLYSGAYYKAGVLGTGLYSGTYYKNGKPGTGLSGGIYYKNGKPGTGLYSGKYYKSGKPGTGIYNKYYYKNGTRGTGLYGAKFYKNGKLLTGTYKNKLYKKGLKYSGVYKNYYYKYGLKQTKYKSTVKKMNNGKIYYFQKNGKVYRGSSWKRIGQKRYYFRKGTALTGWKYVGKYKYYFDSKGKLCQDLIAKFGNKWKKKDIYIKVNRKKNYVILFAKDGKKGYTIPVKAMACSVGKAGTPTVKGTYYLSKDRTYRWAKLGGPTMGGYCYGQYCSRITGSYLFHSVTYRSPNNRTLTTSAYNNLGGPASHGCIRLQTANAKIIYDIARNKKTKVTIYDSNSIGPFDKPSVKKISAGQNYDPTDPNIKR